MMLVAKCIVILFGVFLILTGVLMLWSPNKARELLRKAGSTNLINYSEITIRMIPATGLVVYSELSKYPEILWILGWFMIATSLILYFVPRKLHHKYALWCAEILEPKYIRLLAPVSMLFGSGIIYTVF
jgi:uncharacterized membrane protein YfcA